MGLNIALLETKKLTELYQLAKEFEIPYYGNMKKKELVLLYLKHKRKKMD